MRLPWRELNYHFQLIKTMYSHYQEQSSFNEWSRASWVAQQDLLSTLTTWSPMEPYSTRREASWPLTSVSIWLAHLCACMRVRDWGTVCLKWSMFSYSFRKGDGTVTSQSARKWHILVIHIVNGLFFFPQFLFRIHRFHTVLMIKQLFLPSSGIDLKHPKVGV